MDDLFSHAHRCLRRALSLSLAGAKEEGCRNFMCCNCDGASHETLPSINVLSCVSGRLPDHPGVRIWCFEDALSRSRCGQPPDAIPVPEGGKGFKLPHQCTAPFHGVLCSAFIHQRWRDNLSVLLAHARRRSNTNDVRVCAGVGETMSACSVLRIRNLDRSLVPARYVCKPNTCVLT